MKKFTFCLIGIDGSGKTTHVLTLIRSMNAKGLIAKFAYLRGVGFTFWSFPFIIISKIIRYDIRPDGSTPNIHRHFAFRFRDSIIAEIWAILRLFDVVSLIFIRTYLINAKIIICDRYIYDAIVDLSFILQKDLLHKRFIKFLTKVIKPDIVIFLDLDEKEALKRKQEHSLSVLKKRNQIYRKMATKWGLHVIKSDRPFDVVHDDILNYIVRESQKNAWSFQQ